MLSPIDWSVIVGYFALTLTAAWFGVRRGRTSGKKSQSYFLAGRNAGWLLIGSSLFASNIGSEHLIGLAGTGAANGVAVAQFEIIAAFMLILLGWVFAPIYLKTGVYTMPEFLERRYGPAARWYLAAVSILGYVFTKISVTIAAGSLVLEQLMGIEFWTGATILVVLTGTYTVLGGLTAVLYTDFIQAFVLIFGALLVTFLGMSEVGGVEAFIANAPAWDLSLWRPMSDPDFPWTGILLGAPILGLWYWCTDQFIVQRVLSARNLSEAQKGTVLAGFLKLLPLFIFVIPGMVAAQMVTMGKLTLASADHALPALIASVLPVGIKGLVIAGLLAALMSSLSSVFNSCSTLITFDVFKKLKPKATERELVRFGQLATVVLVVIGMLWIPMMERISGQLYQYLQKVQAYIAPPIAAVFLLGILSPATRNAGALAALYSGFVLGMARLVLEIFPAELGPLQWFVEMNFLHFAFFLFIFCLVLARTVSWIGRPAEIPRTRATMALELRLGRSGRYAIVLMVFIAVIWLVFSPLGIG